MYTAKKIQQLSRDIQTWSNVNLALGITNEGKRRYFERLCQNLNQQAKPTDDERNKSINKP